MKAGAALLLCAVLGASSAQAQSNLGFLADAPVAKFTKADFALAEAAAGEVIRAGKKGTTRSWENAATGNGGSIKLLGSFTAGDGRNCHRLRVANHARGIEGVSTMNVCAGADGKWLLDADARPR
jgi:hypothetical protein